jgi:N-formylglutamate amidohydrolase
MIHELRIYHAMPGRLPDLNFGTAEGRSCDPALIEAVQEAKK